VPAVFELTNSPPLLGAPLIVDQTGVGAAIVDMFRQASRSGALVPVSITASQMTVEQEEYSFAVPKKNLASHVQVLLQQRRLKIARSLPDAKTLACELQTFRVKTSLVGTETVDAWRKGAHDDLVWRSPSRVGGPSVRRSGATTRLPVAERVSSNRCRSACLEIRPTHGTT
jgi:hypothetical protein